MDPIIGNNSPIQSQPQGGAKRDSLSEVKIDSKSSGIEASISLPDISSLARAAHASGPDIRPEAILRAEKLLNDPNWLSDSNLDVLADRILTNEDL